MKSAQPYKPPAAHKPKTHLSELIKQASKSRSSPQNGAASGLNSSEPLKASSEMGSEEKNIVAVDALPYVMPSQPKDGSAWQLNQKHTESSNLEDQQGSASEETPKAGGLSPDPIGADLIPLDSTPGDSPQAEEADAEYRDILGTAKTVGNVPDPAEDEEESPARKGGSSAIDGAKQLPEEEEILDLTLSPISKQLDSSPHPAELSMSEMLAMGMGYTQVPG